MENVKLLLATVLGTIVLIVGVVWFFSQGSTGSTGNAGEPVVVDAALLVDGARHTKGATESAQFTVVEFADFQCPGCAQVAPAVELLVEQFPGRVQVVYRHLPLTSIHPNALPTARAAEAAASFGKFWEMHDALFARQSQWSNRQNIREYVADLAVELGMEREAFLAAYDADETQAAVMTDVRLAEQLGLNSTPTLFLNGQLMSSGEIYEAIAAQVELMPSTTVSTEASAEATILAE